MIHFREKSIASRLTLGEPLKHFRRAWAEVEQTARHRLTGKVRPSLPEDDLDLIRKKINLCLSELGGAASSRARAASLGGDYLGLNVSGKQRFLRLLANEYAVPNTVLHDAIQMWLTSNENNASDESRSRLFAEQNLRKTLRSPRVHLLTQFNALPDGIKFLADMRAQLLSIKKESPSLAAFDKEFKELLASWFDVGFLKLQRITWDAPAALLETLSAHEAVHPIRSWQDIKHRLSADDRCCYAFIHPQMPSDPLIFVWVALTTGIPTNIDELLRLDEETLPQRAIDTAVFYSISATHPGLQGVGFGSFLIKRVVDQLALDHKQLRVFATLSPIPGFRSWLEKESAAAATTQRNPLLTRHLKVIEASGEVARLFSDKARLTDEGHPLPYRNSLLALCAYYLTKEQTGTNALDPVANFHLSNGATVEQLNWMADTSKKGRNEAGGMMVNYRYHLPDIETNHEDYHATGKIAQTKKITALLTR